MNQKRIGIIGGTFDPIHIGHLILAQSAYEQLGLDKVLFIPAGRPPHKRNRSGATDEQRVEMVRLAIETDPHFELSLIEMGIDGYSYTYLTLEKLSVIYEGCVLYFIIGQDSLETFESWYKPEEIVKHAVIVAADRPDCDQSAMEALLLRNRQKFGSEFVGISCPDIQISSHELRKKIEEGGCFRYLVPDPVYHFIEKNRVYRPEERKEQHG